MVEPLEGDFVLHYQNRLRELSSGFKSINDMHILELATKLGAVDDSTMEPVSKHYINPQDVDDQDLLKIIEECDREVGRYRVIPGYAAGAVTATSISEPMYQATMRTFHYAGVGANIGGSSKLIEATTSLTMWKGQLVAIALPADVVSDPSRILSLADGLTRSKLIDYVDIAFGGFDTYQERIDEIIGALYEIESATEYEVAESGAIVPPWLDDPEWSMLNEELQELRQKQYENAISFFQSETIIFKLKEPNDCPRGIQRLDIGNLRGIVKRQVLKGDGSFRVPKSEGLGNLFKNADIASFDDSVNLTIPFLPPRLSSSLLGICENLEFCNNCNSVCNLAKLVNKQGKTETLVVEDESWDSSMPVTDYHARVADELKGLTEQQMDEIQTIISEASGEQVGLGFLADELGIMNNPDHKSDSTGLLYIDVTQFPRVDFELSDVVHDRVCEKCSHGWYNASVSIEQVTMSASRDFDFIDSQLHGVMETTKIAGLQEDDSSIYPEEAYASYPGYSRPGQNSDYPYAPLHSGRLPADMRDGEYYLLLTYQDIEDSRLSGFKGHFQLASKYARTIGIDFDRTTTNDHRQVERVLGIEAARTVIAHNLYNAQGNGDIFPLLKSDGGDTVNYRHYLLLADSMCRSFKAMHLKTGLAALDGVASMKGTRSERVQLDPNKPYVHRGEFYESHLDLPDDHPIPEWDNFRSILGIAAYENQTRNMLEPAVQGVKDDLSHPYSAVVAGTVPKFGTTMYDGYSTVHNSFGSGDVLLKIELLELAVGGDTEAWQSYLSLIGDGVPTHLLLVIKATIDDLTAKADRLAYNSSGYTWFGNDGLRPTESNEGDDAISRTKRQLRNDLLGYPEFSELIDLRHLYRQILLLAVESYDLD